MLSFLGVAEYAPVSVSVLQDREGGEIVRVGAAPQTSSRWSRTAFENQTCVLVPLPPHQVKSSDVLYNQQFSI